MTTLSCIPLLFFSSLIIQSYAIADCYFDAYQRECSLGILYRRRWCADVFWRQLGKCVHSRLRPCTATLSSTPSVPGSADLNLIGTARVMSVPAYQQPSMFPISAAMLYTPQTNPNLYAKVHPTECRNYSGLFGLTCLPTNQFPKPR